MIGYLRLISKDPRRWILCGEDGLEWACGDCVHCTTVAMNHGIEIRTIH